MDYSLILGVHRRRDRGPLYFVAIIDLLQAYDIQKKTENLLRGHMLPMLKKMSSANLNRPISKSTSSASVGSASSSESSPSTSAAAPPSSPRTNPAAMSIEEIESYLSVDDTKLGKVSRGEALDSRYMFGVRWATSQVALDSTTRKLC